MKRAKCYLILSVLAVLVVNLTVWASPVSLKEPLSWLLGRAHPAVARIDAVQVVVLASGDERITDTAFRAGLVVKVEQKLKLATLKIPDPNQPGQAGKPFDTPQFVVNVDVRHYNGEQMLFSVRTTLARPVYVAVREPGSKQLKAGPMVTAAVWTEASPIMPASSQGVRDGITRQTLQQADAFIAAWVASNRSKYVASKNSKVFHLPGCRFAKRISPENLIGYKSRDEAVSAGKRACKFCKP